MKNLQICTISESDLVRRNLLNRLNQRQMKIATQRLLEVCINYYVEQRMNQSEHISSTLGQQRETQAKRKCLRKVARPVTCPKVKPKCDFPPKCKEICPHQFQEVVKKKPKPSRDCTGSSAFSPALLTKYYIYRSFSICTLSHKNIFSFANSVVPSSLPSVKSNALSTQAPVLPIMAKNDEIGKKRLENEMYNIIKNHAKALEEYFKFHKIRCGLNQTDNVKNSNALYWQKKYCTFQKQFQEQLIKMYRLNSDQQCPNDQSGFNVNCDFVINEAKESLDETDEFSLVSMDEVITETRQYNSEVNLNTNDQELTVLHQTNSFSTVKKPSTRKFFEIPSVKKYKPKQQKPSSRQSKVEPEPHVCEAKPKSVGIVSKMWTKIGQTLNEIDWETVTRNPLDFKQRTTPERRPRKKSDQERKICQRAPKVKQQKCSKSEILTTNDCSDYGEFKNRGIDEVNKIWDAVNKIGDKIMPNPNLDLNLVGVQKPNALYKAWKSYVQLINSGEKDGITKQGPSNKSEQITSNEIKKETDQIPVATKADFIPQVDKIYKSWNPPAYVTNKPPRQLKSRVQVGREETNPQPLNVKPDEPKPVKLASNSSKRGVDSTYQSRNKWHTEKPPLSEKIPALKSAYDLISKLPKVKKSSTQRSAQKSPVFKVRPKMKGTSTVFAKRNKKKFSTGMMLRFFQSNSEKIENSEPVWCKTTSANKKLMRNFLISNPKKYFHSQLPYRFMEKLYTFLNKTTKPETSQRSSVESEDLNSKPLLGEFVDLNKPDKVMSKNTRIVESRVFIRKNKCEGKVIDKKLATPRKVSLVPRIKVIPNFKAEDSRIEREVNLTIDYIKNTAGSFSHFKYNCSNDLPENDPISKKVHFVDDAIKNTKTAFLKTEIDDEQKNEESTRFYTCPEIQPNRSETCSCKSDQSCLDKVKNRPPYLSFHKCDNKCEEKKKNCLDLVKKRGKYLAFYTCDTGGDKCKTGKPRCEIKSKVCLATAKDAKGSKKAVQSEKVPDNKGGDKDVLPATGCEEYRSLKVDESGSEPVTVSELKICDVYKAKKLPLDKAPLINRFTNKGGHQDSPNKSGKDTPGSKVGCDQVTEPSRPKSSTNSANELDAQNCSTHKDSPDRNSLEKKLENIENLVNDLKQVVKELVSENETYDVDIQNLRVQLLNKLNRANSVKSAQLESVGRKQIGPDGSTELKILNKIQPWWDNSNNIKSITANLPNETPILRLSGSEITSEPLEQNWYKKMFSSPPSGNTSPNFPQVVLKQTKDEKHTDLISKLSDIKADSKRHLKHYLLNNLRLRQRLRVRERLQKLANQSQIELAKPEYESEPKISCCYCGKEDGNCIKTPSFLPTILHPRSKACNCGKMGCPSEFSLSTHNKNCLRKITGSMYLLKVGNTKEQIPIMESCVKDHLLPSVSLKMKCPCGKLGCSFTNDNNATLNSAYPYINGLCMCGKKGCPSEKLNAMSKSCTQIPLLENSFKYQLDNLFQSSCDLNAVNDLYVSVRPKIFTSTVNLRKDVKNQNKPKKSTHLNQRTLIPPDSEMFASSLEINKNGQIRKEYLENYEFSTYSSVLNLSRSQLLQQNKVNFNKFSPIFAKTSIGETSDEQEMSSARRSDVDNLFGSLEPDFVKIDQINAPENLYLKTKSPAENEGSECNSELEELSNPIRETNFAIDKPLSGNLSTNPEKIYMNEKFVSPLYLDYVEFNETFETQNEDCISQLNSLTYENHFDSQVLPNSSSSKFISPLHEEYITGEVPYLHFSSPSLPSQINDGSNQQKTNESDMVKRQFSTMNLFKIASKYSRNSTPNLSSKNPTSLKKNPYLLFQGFKTNRVHLAGDCKADKSSSCKDKCKKQKPECPPEPCPPPKPATCDKPPKCPKMMCPPKDCPKKKECPPECPPKEPKPKCPCEKCVESEEETKTAKIIVESNGTDFQNTLCRLNSKDEDFGTNSDQKSTSVENDSKKSASDSEIKSVTEDEFFSKTNKVVKSPCDKEDNPKCKDKCANQPEPAESCPPVTDPCKINKKTDDKAQCKNRCATEKPPPPPDQTKRCGKETPTDLKREYDKKMKLRQHYAEQNKKKSCSRTNADDKDKFKRVDDANLAAENPKFKMVDDMNLATENPKFKRVDDMNLATENPKFKRVDDANLAAENPKFKRVDDANLAAENPKFKRVDDANLAAENPSRIPQKRMYKVCTKVSPWRSLINKIQQKFLDSDQTYSFTCMPCSRVEVVNQLEPKISKSALKESKFSCKTCGAHIPASQCKFRCRADRRNSNVCLFKCERSPTGSTKTGPFCKFVCNTDEGSMNVCEFSCEKQPYRCKDDKKDCKLQATQKQSKPPVKQNICESAKSSAKIPVPAKSSMNDPLKQSAILARSSDVVKCDPEQKVKPPTIPVVPAKSNDAIKSCTEVKKLQPAQAKSSSETTVKEGKILDPKKLCEPKVQNPVLVTKKTSSSEKETPIKDDKILDPKKLCEPKLQDPVVTMKKTSSSEKETPIKDGKILDPKKLCEPKLQKPVTIMKKTSNSEKETPIKEGKILDPKKLCEPKVQPTRSDSVVIATKTKIPSNQTSKSGQQKGEPLKPIAKKVPINSCGQNDAVAGKQTESASDCDANRAMPARMCFYTCMNYPDERETNSRTNACAVFQEKVLDEVKVENEDKIEIKTINDAFKSQYSFEMRKEYCSKSNTVITRTNWSLETN